MGAATSFLVREGRVKRISGETLPVGIIPRLKLTHISATLRPGDVVLMVSDGITESDRNDMEARWLESYLLDFADTYLTTACSPMRVSPRHLASEILDMASSRYNGRERDDLTAAAVIIADSGINR